MNNVISITVEGTEYIGFTAIRVIKSFESISGAFSFEATALENTFPLKVGQSCIVKINDEAIVTGYIDRINVDYDASSHLISISGRDKTNDIVDSTLGDGLDFNSPISLVQIINNVLKLLNITNIKVLTNESIELFKESDMISGHVGVNAFDFIESYCRMRQIIITSDGDGNIVLSRAGNNQYRTILSLSDQSKSSILSATISYDNSRRFNKYYVKSQQNDSATVNLLSTLVSNSEIFSDKTPEINISPLPAVDKEIRNTRIYYMLSEDVTDIKIAKKRAEWEANYRRTHARQYFITVQGFNPIDDDILWHTNYLIRVIDDFSDVNELLLINGIEYIFSLDQGSITNLNLISKDAYSLIKEEAQPAKIKNLFTGFIQ